MSETKPKRRWFQFHLATAVLMMFMAGGCIFFNVEIYLSIRYLVREKTLYEPDTTFVWWQTFLSLNAYSFIILGLFELAALVLTYWASEFIIRRREGRTT